MCGSTADIQFAAAEIRRGKKEEERTSHSMKIYMVSLLHRATINKLDGCIVWNAHNTVLGGEALLIYIIPVCYVKTGR